MAKKPTYEALECKIKELENKVVECKQAEKILRQNLKMYQTVEEALRENEERIRATFNAINDAVFLHPLLEEGFASFTDVNDTACRRYGYTHEEFLTLKATEITKRTDASTHSTRDHRQELRDTGQMIFEAIHITKSGEEFPVEINSTIITLNGRPMILAVVRDITERKRAEEALRMSHKTFLMVLDSIDATVYVADMETYEILFMNKKMIEIYGKDMTSEICWDAFRGKSKPCRHCTNDQLLDENGKPGGVSVWHGKNPITKKWFINYDRAIEWIDGRLVRIQIASDITDYKIMEQQLQQAQKMEAIGTLAGGIAHDFNNMLSVILGRSEMLLMDLNPGDHHTAELVEIQTAATRSRDLTQQLLTFARRQTIAPKVLDLNEIVEGILKMIRRLIGEDIDLVWQPAKKIWPVKMDPAQVNQIMTNLCVNSRDAISGTGKVTIETANVVLDSKYCAIHPGSTPGQHVMLAVSDDGCGMEKETLDKAFEPFFTTKATGEGTGLGLATVYGIMKQNTGFINIDSELGQGSTIQIYFPRIEENLEAVDNPKVGSLAKGSETVLLVEDEPSILDLGKTMLERFGYKVLPAHTPSEAISIAEKYKEPIHLLLTDVVMPELNGKELKTQIEKYKPHIKVLFMSGYTANVILHRGILERDVHFLQKPFSLESLANKVRNVLNG